MKKFTIFTPTYNRANCIDALYNSLVNQTYKNFEWLVVDDGSTDETEQKFKKIKSDNLIDLTYIKVKNGGKHRAINIGIERASGELFFIVDSDDELTVNSLEIVNKYVKLINDSKIVGVCGLRAQKNYKPIGTTFNGETLDIYNYERSHYKISGDKAEVYFTKILKNYKFPEFENEKFLSEAIVWNKIALDGYKLKYFNEIIYLCDYLNDGLTKNLFKNYKNSPQGFLTYVKQQLGINKFNLIEQIKLVSLYYQVMKDVYSKKQIAKQLDKSLLFINISIFIRNILKKGVK